jgi:predicted ABC-type transport system involved in lysophospholipase L1 biosynthesis ATPase subunit
MDVDRVRRSIGLIAYRRRVSFGAWYLDSKSQDKIIQLLHRLREERQLTLVIVTHSHEVAQAADRRIPMKDGQIQQG